jgi:hypothetical protein
VISDAFLSVLFVAMFILFGSNVKQAVMERAIWGLRSLASKPVEKSENPFGFWIVTLLSTFFSLVSLAMALLLAANMIGIGP